AHSLHRSRAGLQDPQLRLHVVHLRPQRALHQIPPDRQRPAAGRVVPGAPLMATRRAPVVGSDHTGSLDPEPAAPARPAVSAKRPDIKVTAAREEQRFVGPIPLAIGFIALAGVLSMALRAHSRAEDANFVSARDG